jgi:hypothetical protein
VRVICALSCTERLHSYPAMGVRVQNVTFFVLTLAPTSVDPPYLLIGVLVSLFEGVFDGSA